MRDILHPPLGAAEAGRASPRRIPRLSEADLPVIHGVAAFEWNIAEGTTWYSPGWEAIIQSDDYEWAWPKNIDWWGARLHPNDAGALQRARLALQVGFVEQCDVTLRLQRPDGSWRWLYYRVRVTEKGEDGAPLFVSGICIDQTELLSGSGATGGSSSVSDIDFHSMLESSPDLFARFDRDLSFIYMNPAILNYWGGKASVRGLVGVSAKPKIIAAYKALLRYYVERVFRERAAIREKVLFTLSVGTEIFGEASFWPEFDTRGAVQFVIMQFRDLTEQRRTEQRSRLNEQRLEALYKLTCMEDASEPEVLGFVMDSVLSLTRSKSGFIFIPEAEHSDKGHMFWSADHYSCLDPGYLPDDRMPQELVDHVTDETGNKIYRGIYNGDGVTRICSLFGGKMDILRSVLAPGKEDSQVVCVAGVCNKDAEYAEDDLQQLETFINSAWLILRRRRFIQELQETKAAAEAASKAKDAFLANISHELRTPLNGVLSMLQLIDTLPLGLQQQEYLKTAQSSGKALLRIISDLLDFSCMESGKMPLALDVFDCRETVRSALAVFEDEAVKRGLSFTYQIDPAIPERLLGDEARVRQIIFNIVGNALKFTLAGGISVSCGPLPQKAGKAGVFLSFADTGIGIPQDKLSGIFDAFVQMERALRRKYSGTGLGLSIVKHLVSMMDGTVTMESAPGVGTTVKCSLYFDVPAPEAARPAAVPGEEDIPARPLDILVAEDDSVGSFALRSFLQGAGHRVFCVEDGKQALEALRSYPFHCLFTDIEMPDIGGLELVGHIRRGDGEAFSPSEAMRARVGEAFPHPPGEPVVIDPDLTVVAVSAHSMIGDKERFLRHGINYYIAKPIIREELEAALRYVNRRLRWKSRAD